MASLLPAIGTEQFRCLPYQRQLEIVSLQLFDPEEYERQTGQDARAEPLDPLTFPPLPEVDLPDLPVTFLDNYWAGYSAKYRAEWYGVNSPLLEYGVREQRMVNICTFNFPFIGMKPAIFYVVKYLRKWFFNTFNVMTLTHACKVLIYLDQVLKGHGAHYLFSEWAEIQNRASSEVKSETSALKLYRQALDCLGDVSSLREINDIQEVVQDDHWMLHHIQRQTLVVHPIAKSMAGRWFFPLVPSALYRDGRFHIYNWDWLQHKCGTGYNLGDHI